MERGRERWELGLSVELWAEVLGWCSLGELCRSEEAGGRLGLAARRLWASAASLRLHLCRVPRFGDGELGGPAEEWSFGLRLNGRAYAHDRLWAARRHLARLLSSTEGLTRLALTAEPQEPASDGDEDREAQAEAALADRYHSFHADSLRQILTENLCLERLQSLILGSKHFLPMSKSSADYNSLLSKAVAKVKSLRIEALGTGSQDLDEMVSKASGLTHLALVNADKSANASMIAGKPQLRSLELSVPEDADQSRKMWEGMVSLSKLSVLTLHPAESDPRLEELVRAAVGAGRPLRGVRWLTVGRAWEGEEGREGGQRDLGHLVRAFPCVERLNLPWESPRCLLTTAAALLRALPGDPAAPREVQLWARPPSQASLSWLDFCQSLRSKSAFQREIFRHDQPGAVVQECPVFKRQFQISISLQETSELPRLLLCFPFKAAPLPATLPSPTKDPNNNFSFDKSFQDIHF